MHNKKSVRTPLGIRSQEGDCGYGLAKWAPVYKALGRDRTIKLINNGTSLEVAKQMIKAKDEVEQLKLDL